MGFFKKDPKEANYVGGQKNWAESLQNVGSAGEMISLHPDEDFNTNTILTVNPGEQAIFVKNGQIQQVFKESGRYQLTTENYPFISRIRNAFTGGISTFRCRVFFVRTAISQEMLWASGEMQVRDKKLRVATKVFARGAYKVSVEDGPKFLSKLIGNNMPSFGPEEIEDYFKHEFLETIVTELVTALNEREGEILGIQSKQRELSNIITPIIAEIMSDYGVKLDNFSISKIEVDMDDEVRRAYEAKLGNASADSEVMDILGDKWAAQQQVDIMKTMAANQGTAGIGAGIGMGMAAAGSFFGMGQQMMGQPMMQQQPQQYAQPAAAPPPMMQFYIYLNNQQVGPMPMQQLAQYVPTGQLTPNTLVWREGMPQWAAASSVPELQQLFARPTPSAPPTPPTPPTM